MCELLGISVSPAATMGVYFKEFRPRAAENTSGWGMGWYEDGTARLVKEPVRADVSETCEALTADPPTSHLFLIHVRAATVGALTEENTHPFRERLHGKEWLFEHNGTIRDPERLPVGRFRQHGQTDSEVAFHFILARIDELGADAGAGRVADQILHAGRDLSRTGRCNFLLTDGETLYAYYDGHRTLHFVEHRAEDLGTLRGEDDDYTIRLRLGDAPDERAVIIASVPITAEAGWTKLEPGTFLVCRAGAVVQRVPPLQQNAFLG